MAVYFANIFLLWSLCEAQLSEISQPVPLQTLKLGDSATIKCYIKSKMMKRVWYKLTVGRRLQLVATLDSHYNRSVFADGFQHRYSVKFDSINTHLSISPTSWDDVGTYFCGAMHLNDIVFGSGTFLMVKGVQMISESVVQQPESWAVQSGDSVTLRCSVQSGQCAAEHTSVMWLKNSDHSPPEMIYSSGNKNNACQRTESGQTICVYNRLMSNVSSDDAGTYYCVVTSCQQILFGNGTKLIFQNGTDFHDIGNIQLLALVMVINLVVYLAFFVCMNSKRNCSHCTGSSTTTAEIQEGEHLKIKRSKRQRDDTWSECVYFSVKQYN